ncbi:NLP/P60 protein [Streptomyces filamentosus NRRL 15998]|uniref:NLP/P60 protein n=1 Tax=Streptomyces filamentosus NRRL 15998 TaxID=457431 RepID=D6AHC7_STRFL|nr:NLP/P60 protein [Streptomyces filamentosus NRRL 15998]
MRRLTNRRFSSEIRHGVRQDPWDDKPPPPRRGGPGGRRVLPPPG